ncbi:MAG: hypothetical protein AAFX80_08940 [Cyanobacteria bacterium J06639_18]
MTRQRHMGIGKELPIPITNYQLPITNYQLPITNPHKKYLNKRHYER